MLYVHNNIFFVAKLMLWVCCIKPIVQPYAQCPNRPYITNLEQLNVYVGKSYSNAVKLCDDLQIIDPTVLRSSFGVCSTPPSYAIRMLDTNTSVLPTF